MTPSEATPLISMGGATRTSDWRSERSFRDDMYDFLEAKTPIGSVYEWITIWLIILNVLAFILGSLFVVEYNVDAGAWAAREGGICGSFCDSLWFGNYADNDLSYLGIGATSWLEIITVAIFTVDYFLRLWVADLENPKYQGFIGRIMYLPTFYSVVDLASTLPFFVDSFILTGSDLFASQVRIHINHTISLVDTFSSHQQILFKIKFNHSS